MLIDSRSPDNVFTLLAGRRQERDRLVTEPIAPRPEPTPAPEESFDFAAALSSLTGASATLERAFAALGASAGDEAPGEAMAAPDVPAAIETFNEAVRAIYQRTAQTEGLERSVRSTMIATFDTLALDEASGYGLLLDAGSPPQLVVDRERLEAVLSQPAAELSTLVTGIGTLAGAVAASVQASQDRDRAEQRTAELAAATEREVARIEPGVAAALDRVVQTRIIGVLDALVSQSTEEARRARQAEKARKAYGVEEKTTSLEGGSGDLGPGGPGEDTAPPPFVTAAPSASATAGGTAGLAAAPAPKTL